MRFALSALASATLVIAEACYLPVGVPLPLGTVRFQLDAPLCSSVLPLRFLVDGRVVSSDTFVVGFGDRPLRTTHDVQMTATAHDLSVQLFRPVLNDYGAVDGLATQHVNVPAGGLVVDTLHFYCS